MNKTIYGSTLAAAILLTLLCLALPSYQWASLSGSALLKGLAGAGALALGICKITFFPIAIDKWLARRRLLALVFFLTASIALFFSVSATSQLIAESATATQNGQAASSFAHRQAVNNVNDLNNAIAALTDNIERDVTAGYRQRAIDQQGELVQLMQRRDAAIESVNNLAHAAPNGTGSTFLKNLTIGQGELSLSISGATGAAIALHLGCVLSILALSQAAAPVNASAPQKTAEPRPAKEKNKGRKEQQLDAFRSGAVVIDAEKFNDEQRALYNAIKKGDYGQQPVMRNIINDTVITGGHKKVSPVFECLVQDNVLQKVGRNYKLTSEGQ